MERPERVVLIILGALFERWGVMAPVLWVLAVISTITITVIHRIVYTYQQTRHLAPVTEIRHVVQTATQPVPQSIAMRESRGSDPRPDLPAANAPRV